MRPADILALQAELHQKLGDPNFAGYFDRYTELTLEKAGVKGNSPAASYSEMVRGWLKVADAYRIESHMNSSIEHHARAFADTDLAHDYMPENESGFVVFEEPLKFTEIGGQTHLIHVLFWAPVRLQMSNNANRDDTDLDLGGPGGKTVMYFGFNDTTREPDEVFLRNKRAECNPLLGGDVEQWEANQRVAGRWAMAMAYAAVGDWTMGAPSIKADANQTLHLARRGIEVSGHGATNVRRRVHALWGLLAQVLPGAHREPVEVTDGRRPAVRRLKLKAQVDLVTLRRIEEPRDATGTGTPWSVRAIISGHYRTYHRGQDNEFSIWISEHEAGPKNAPLSMRRKVKNLSR